MPTTGLLRSRINDRLARAAHYPVTLIVAPAGFGKTVALRDFIAAAGLDVAQYSVPREDATLLAYAHGLARALGGRAPDALAAFPAIQERVLTEESPVATLADWFVEHLRPVVTTIVIDDLHHAAADPRSVELTVALIERTTGHVNWIIATRSDAGIPVASWLAYGRIDVPIGEDDLRFTSDEAMAAALDARADIPIDEIDALRDVTAGWPVALSIALRTRTHVTDLRAATAGAREMLFRYLAEQVFNTLSPRERELLLDTSVFASFDASLVVAMGGSPSTITELRRSTSFVNEIAPGVFRYHDLFRDFLETELSRAGRERWVFANARAARVLENERQFAAALALYVRAEDDADVMRLLGERGADLYERGEAETIERAIALIANGHITDARVLGVKAMSQAGRGHFGVAERDFIDAIARAQDATVRLELVQRYALELIRNGRDAIALLAPYAEDWTIDCAARVSLLGTYATALARTGLLQQAVENIARGIEIIDASVPDVVRARFHQQAAFVHQHLPDRGNAWRYAQLAVDLAKTHGLFDVAARAYSVLYSIVYDDEDDPIESLSLLGELIECARKGGNVQTRMWGVFASMDIEVDRGDDGAIARLEREIERNAASFPGVSEAALLPAHALRATWEGDFARAHEILAPTVAHIADDERRTLRWAEIALYALAARRVDEGAAAIIQANEALARTRSARRRARAQLVLALAELVRGQSAAAHRFISEVEHTSGLSRRLRALMQSVRVFYRKILGQADDAEVAAALERLHAVHFGGLSRMMGQLPLGAGESNAYASLTAAERDILADLVRGGSSKEIAQRSGRSAQTVDTHIRSICRKLHCSGRLEAVALAVRSGWV